MAEYLDYWLEHVVKPERRRTTYSGYETMVRVHISPALGRRKLDELGPADVRHFLATLRAKDTDGHGGGPRKLSPRIVQFAHAVLRNALSNAVREELVSRNVAKLVKMSNPEYDIGAGLASTRSRLGRSFGRSPTTGCSPSTCAPSCSGCEVSCSGWRGMRSTSPHVVREIAGHSDIKVTMMVYAHGNIAEKAEALTQLGGTLLSRTDVTPPPTIEQDS